VSDGGEPERADAGRLPSFVDPTWLDVVAAG
jgi:hypothetical protein